MKTRRLLTIILIFLTLFVTFIPRVLANPVLIGLPPYELAFFFFVILIIAFVVTVGVEFLILRLFLRHFILKNTKFFKFVVIVNLITFPLTQTIAFLAFGGFQIPLLYFLFYNILIEMVPIGLESLLYLKIYNSFYASAFRNPVRNKTTLMSTITANFSTFLIGLIITIPQIIY